LKEGFARCVDWSMALMKTGADKLRLAEKAAKEARIRIWKDYQATGPQISYTATVVEVVNGDALKMSHMHGKRESSYVRSLLVKRFGLLLRNQPIPPESMAVSTLARMWLQERK